MRILRNSPTLYFLAVSLAALLTSCSVYETSPPVSAPDGYSNLTPTNTIGQTFVAQNAGLDGIGFILKSSKGATGTLQLHLRDHPESRTDLATADLSITEIESDQINLFKFEPVVSSFRKYYYAFLQLEGTGEILIGNSSSESYLDGAMYLNHQAIDLQSFFNLTYDAPIAGWGFGKEIVYWVLLSGVGALLFFLPGYSLLLSLWPSFKELGFPSQLGLSFGLSLAIYPVLFLLTHLIGINLGGFYAWLPAAVGALLSVWHLRSLRSLQTVRHRLISWRNSDTFFSDLAFLILTIIIAGGRFFQVRTIDLPMWGDSLQHTMIAKLLVNNGGLFESWSPYAELQSLTYHFGFHTHVAVFHWITQIPLPQSTIWTGQILNIFAVLGLYPLVLKTGGTRWGATVAVLIAGVFSPMPNFYTNWGRYTQLAGQAILPAMIFLTWVLLEEKSFKTGLFLAAVLATTGLALTHYRVLMFAVLFFPAFLLLRLRMRGFLTMFFRTIYLGVAAGLLFLPWFLNTFKGTITAALFKNLGTPASQTSLWAQGYNAIGSLDRYLHPVLWVLLSVAVAYLVLLRRRRPLTILLWWGLLVIATNPQWLRLPGEGLISNFALFIAAYIPASVLIGTTLNHSIPLLPRRFRLIALFVVTTLGIWFTFDRIKDINPLGHALATYPDIRAAAWIDENTPHQATFLTHAFFAYDGFSIVGGDGGWWLPLLANRSVTLPPLNYSSEKGPTSNYRERVNSIWALVVEKGITDQEVLDTLESRGVTHIYIGQRNGRVNNSGPNYLPVEVLRDSTNFRSVYHEDRVWIFQIMY